MRNTARQSDESRRIKKIHTLKSVLGLSEEEYRLTLFHNFRVDSSKRLSHDQQEELIRELESEAVQKGVWQKFEGKSRFESLGQRSGMASPAQLRKIEALWKDASDIKDHKFRAKALRTFLCGHFKVSDLRFLEEDKVKKVINALNHMVMRKKAGSTVSRQEVISCPTLSPQRPPGNCAQIIKP